MKQILTLILLLWVNFLYAQDRRMVEPSSIDTTMVLPGITLRLSPAEAQSMESYLLPTALIDSLTKGIQNTHRYSRAIEQYQMKQFGNRMQRTQKGLSLKLNNGSWQLIEVDPQTDEMDNVFEHYFEEFGYYSLRVQWGEGNGYKLVNAETGAITHLIGRPFFSPDGSRLIALGNDIEAEYSPNGFELMENVDGKISSLGRYNPGSWGCMSALWLTNNSLVLHNQSLESKPDSGWGYFSFYTGLELIKP
ncbi:MAG: hypothetical protein HEP71_30675 [Roseivirga sp.]|nr:hypothetical protein [Roseivirga sp.]